MWNAVVLGANAVFWAGYLGYVSVGHDKVWRGSFAEMEAAERGERRFAQHNRAQGHASPLNSAGQR